MFPYNVCLNKPLLEHSVISFKAYLLFSMVIYLFTLVQEANFDKRDVKVGMALDQRNLLKITEHLFYVHFFLMVFIYTNNYFLENIVLIKFNSVAFSISNILIIFFFLAILNVAHYYNLSISNIRAQIIKLSYYLIISFILCNNLILWFILIEIYSVLFFLYLIGFNFNLQEVLYYLQHDLAVYIFFGFLSTLFFLFGIFFIIMDFGILSLNFTVLKTILENNYLINNQDFTQNLVNYRGIFCILIGLFIKIGLAPFQGWTVRFFKRTCFQTIIYMLLISKLILIFGAFFSILPIFIKITPILKFIGLFGFVSYILGSYLVLLKHSETDKLLAHINLTSSGFFFFIFFINNTQNYNFAFIYFGAFTILLNFILLVFFSPIMNWYSKVGEIANIYAVRDMQRKPHLTIGSAFSVFDKISILGYYGLTKNELCKLFLHAVLASLPPTVTFYAKLLYDFSFFNSMLDITTPYGLILLIGMLTYIITVYGFLAIWKNIYLHKGNHETAFLIKHNMIVIAEGHNLLSYIRIFKRYNITMFYIGGFAFANFQIL